MHQAISRKKVDHSIINVFMKKFNEDLGVQLYDAIALALEK
jgi:hypothetical protein